MAGRGGAGPGKFVSRVRSPGAPAVAAQVPSAGVGMELPAVNLKVETGRARCGQGGSPKGCGRAGAGARLFFFKKDFRGRGSTARGRRGW